MRLDQWLAEFTDITLGHHGHGDDTGTISGFAGAIPVADRGFVWAVAHTLMGSCLF